MASGNGNGTPVTGDRDIKGDIVAKLDEKAFPSLKNFFEGLRTCVVGNDGTLRAIEIMQEDAAGRALLKIMDDVVTTQDGRYNQLNDRLNDQASQAQVAIDNMTATISNGNAELNKYKDTLTRVRAERDTWKEAASGTASGGGNGGGGDRDGTMPHPTPFTGDEKDTAKRANQFRTWQTRVTGRWVSRPSEFNTDGKKIMYAAALLDGSAATGVFTGVQKVTANPGDTENWPWKTATAFMDHLSKKYATIDLAACAENKLRALSQKDEFAAFTDFLTEFTNLSDQAEWDGTTRVRALKEKLSKRMREGLALQLTTPEKHDFEAWVEMAQKLATNLEGEDHLRKANSNNNNNGGNRNSNGGGAGGAGKAKDPDAMDLDQMRVNMAKIPEDEKLRRANDGLCFNCGKAGHIARRCRSATNPGRGGRGGQRGGNSGGQRGGYANYGQGYGGQWQGPPQGNYGPQQNNNNGHFGYPQQWPQNNANNNSSVPARRGGTRGGYPTGHANGGGARVSFMGVQNPGHVVGEVESESNWGNYGYQNPGYDSQGEDDGNQGNA